jgi:hypothetical protein
MSTAEGERVEQLIYGWLNRHYPDGPAWYARPAIAPPIEVRMIVAFDNIEYNIGNGGWAQFLWNRFEHWRAVVATGREGYRLIGAPEQSAALDTLWGLCERDEQESSETIKRSIRETDEERYGSPPFFAEFTSRSYSAPPNNWEPLFYHDSGVYEKRLAWLATNEFRVRRALQKSPLQDGGVV